MYSKSYTQLNTNHTGYIAGRDDGIVTVVGKPASRHIYLLSADTLQVIQRVTSLNSGHYMFIGINTLQEYLVMVRDHKRELEPFAWDYVTPADDLTVVEQQALWQTWQ